ncbi:hypothetical protein LRE75_03285, partial [Streptomyces sp. 372A]
MSISSDVSIAREQQLNAAREGLRKEWKVTFYECDEDGLRKTGPQAAAHIRYVTALPTWSERVVAHAVFHHLRADPSVSEVDMIDYDIEPIGLVPAEED